MSHVKQHELGIIGLALLRTWLIGEKAVTESIINELYEITDKLQKTTFESKKVKAYNILTGYRIWANTYDSVPNLLIEVEEIVVKSILKVFPLGQALDAGCGTGRYSKFLHSLGHKVTGVDLSPAMLRKARASNHKINFLRGDLRSLPIDNSSIDLAISALVLTHVPDINCILSELSRVVRSGGHIILSDIHPWIVALGGQADFIDKAGKYGYIRNYVHWHSAYIQIFQKLGLKIIKCVEPMVNEEHINLAQKSFNLSATTITAALKGLPLALIWVLEKS